MSKRSTKQSRNIFQRIEDSYMVPTYRVSDYRGETRPPQKDGPMLIVTCAIIIRERKILICQRSSTMDLPLKWEFPGGKVEPGEDEEATVVREISEELHLDIEVVKRLEPVEHDYPTFRIRLIPFVAIVVDGELLLEEHADARWVTVSELDRYDWAPADVPIVEQLKTLDIWN